MFYLLCSFCKIHIYIYIYILKQLEAIRRSPPVSDASGGSSMAKGTCAKAMALSAEAPMACAAFFLLGGGCCFLLSL